MSMNRQWRLAARPRGQVKESDFSFHEVPVPAPAEGEVLVRTLYLSFDPAQRGWMDDRPSYVPPVGLGEVMRAGGVGQVVESRRSDLLPGQLVQGALGWQDYAVAQPGGILGLTRLMPGMPPTWALGVCGITGLTAYFGLLDVGRPVAGETVVVSGAAGATGSVVGQIARLKGCRVIGIAGGADKCRWLTEEAGFDGVVDYKSESVSERLRALCPRGINLFFDNVGGEILDAALSRLAQRGRVVLCGGISGYNAEGPVAGPRNYLNLVVQRGRMEGFIVMDYRDRYGEGVEALVGWVKGGQIKHQEDVQEGLENAPRTMLRLFAGQNRGKQVLRVAEPPLPVVE